MIENARDRCSTWHGEHDPAPGTALNLPTPQGVQTPLTSVYPALQTPETKKNEESTQETEKFACKTTDVTQQQSAATDGRQHLHEVGAELPAGDDELPRHGCKQTQQT